MKFKNVVFTIIASCTIGGCTSIETEKGHSGKGIPYYMPKPILLVKEPVEIERSSELFAVVSLDGITTSLYTFSSDLDSGIAELKKRKTLQTNIELFPIPAEAVNEIKSTTKLDKKDVNDKVDKSILNENTKEFAAKSGPVDESIFTYKPADPGKSFEVVYVPDTNRPYSLKLNPGIFGGKVSATVTDGWKLTALNADQDISASLSALTTLAGTMLTQRTDLKKAEITRDKELELAQLAQSSGTPGDSGVAQAAQSAAPSNVSVVKFHILGYLRKTTIKTVAPGAYDFNSILGANNLPTDTTEVWQRISF